MIVFSCGCVTQEDLPATQRCECGGFQVTRILHKERVDRVRKGRVTITRASYLDVLQSSPNRLIVMNFEPALFPVYDMQRNIVDLNCPYMKAVADNELQVIVTVPAQLQPYLYYQARAAGNSVNSIIRSNGTCIVFINTDIRSGSLRKILNNLKSKYILFGELPSGVVPVKGSEIVVEQRYRYLKLAGG